MDTRPGPIRRKPLLEENIFFCYVKSLIVSRPSCATQPPITAEQRPAGDLASLIGAIGEASFENKLLLFLNSVCRAEHLTLFRLGPDHPSDVVSVSLDGTDVAHRKANLYRSGKFWKLDPLMVQAQKLRQGPDVKLLHLDIGTLPSGDLRDVVYHRMRDRLLICGRNNQDALALSILMSDRQGKCSANDITSLAGMADTVLALLSKHLHIKWHSPDLQLSLTSLHEIEECIAKAPEAFPKREAEVCARILYGLSTIGIALDLHIGEETVTTYRKRAYHRLNVATQRELLLWYIALWKTVHDDLLLSNTAQ